MEAIKKLIRGYYENFHAHIVRQNKWIKSLKTTNYQVKQDEVNNLHSPITIKKIEFLIKNLPKNKSAEPDRFTGNI